MTLEQLSRANTNVQPWNPQGIKKCPVDLLAQLKLAEHDLAGEQTGPHTPRIED